METQKWTTVTSGNFDYVKIIGEIDNTLIEYFNTTKENQKSVVLLASDICEKHNAIIKLIK